MWLTNLVRLTIWLHRCYDSLRQCEEESSFDCPERSPAEMLIGGVMRERGGVMRESGGVIRESGG